MTAGEGAAGAAAYEAAVARAERDLRIARHQEAEALIRDLLGEMWATLPTYGFRPHRVGELRKEDEAAADGSGMLIGKTYAGGEFTVRVAMGELRGKCGVDYKVRITQPLIERDPQFVTVLTQVIVAAADGADLTVERDVGGTLVSISAGGVTADTRNRAGSSGDGSGSAGDGGEG